MITKALQFGLLSAIAVVAPVFGATFPILPEQVVAGLAAKGVRIKASEIDTLSTPSSRHMQPVLEVVSLEPWREGTMKARVTCRDHSECLPFFVAVKIQGAEGFRGSKPLNEDANPNSIILRAGATTTLLLQTGRVQITLPVICLENGSVGRTIRVTTRDRKQIYRAEVVNEKLLKGESSL